MGCFLFACATLLPDLMIIQIHWFFGELRHQAL
jgi:hypothetical protein